MKKYLLLLIACISLWINSNAQGIGPIPGSQIRGTSEILGGLMVDSLIKLPIRALTAWPYANNKMSAIGLLQVNSADTLPYYLKSGSTWQRLLTTADTSTFGHVNSVSGTIGRTSSTGGANPIIDLVTVNANPATSGSGTAIPIITYDAYGRLTTITTVSPTNPTITLSGDVSGSGTTAITTTLTTVNTTPGTFGSNTAIPIITIDSKGRATAITTVSPSTAGLVTSVSIISANGFAGTVANATSTPAITLTTTVNAAVVKGNGTALIPAVSGTDYQAPGNYITALTGDVTSTGPGSVTSTIATVNPNTGTFGSASVVPQITFNAKGQATSVTTVAISASPSGTAGGDLTGTYPNPTIATVNASPATYGSSTAIPVIAINSKGQATTITTSVVVAPAGTLSGSAINSSVTGSSLTSTGAITSGTWSTGAVIGTPTMTLGSDASFDMYYRNGSGVLTRLVNGTTGQVMTATTSSAPSWVAPATAGTVTSVSVVTANGFSGTVANATTTPAITMQTSLNTPIIAGNGTALIAATTTGSGSTAVLSAGPTFTGVVTIPTPFTLGAISVTSTGTQLNYLANATGTTGTNTTNVVFSTNPTFSGITISNATSIVCNGSTGVKLASTSSEKLGFWGATPVVRQSGSVITGLQTMGLMTSATIAASEVSGLADASQTATDANYTVTSPTTIGTIVNLPVITANRNLLLPSPSSFSGYTLKIWNKNTSGTFSWTFTTNAPKDAAGNAISTVVNSSWYILISDGTNWVKTN